MHREPCLRRVGRGYLGDRGFRGELQRVRSALRFGFWGWGLGLRVWG